MHDMMSCLVIPFLLLKFIQVGFCIEPRFSLSSDISYPSADQKVLFLTNSDHEQSNAFLATCQSLIQYPFVDVHFASFPELRDEVSNLHTGLSRVRFHALNGTPYAKRLELEEYRLSGLSHPPGFHGAVASRKDLPISQVPWNGTEYLEMYRSMLDVIKAVDPTLVVIDPMLKQANDAVLQLGYQYMILSASNLRDVLVTEQPAGKMIREFPAIGSGFSSPLPWYLAPCNAYLWLRRAFTMVFSSHLRKLKSCRQHHGVANPVNLVEWYRDEVTVLVTSSLEIEYPMFVPPNVIACGPIIPLVPSIVRRDQCWQDCLKCWHDSSQPILLIDLQRLTKDDTIEIVRTLFYILLEYDDLQVLWNIKNQTEDSRTDDIHLVVDTFSSISYCRTRKLQLNMAGIASLLTSEAISCVLHRGETGLFHDALTSGVPQLLLPKWQRDYDYAVQAEWLGVGKWANRDHAPFIANGELTDAIRSVLDQERDGVHIAQQAKQISSVLQTDPGQNRAAQEILKTLRLPNNRTKERWRASSDEL
ncbi:UDP-glucoronosyl and UDP-glucosyl transferase family protein [Penicillium cinerascens]|uniref:UDP-glucoronosyl and UDP-glucosyl transferase family protein n=1 Tax=Penicillium cinerascens TaxID=70096 RepID=A0A9W9N2P1_9EURO|nr:UDP-glucoronosyl and UDP-glucosyl transferase family protein [Penicillium cinerascens]KAJ5212071.1 UDP-glucoronosyl and UDP-glucosyl transferase family protein [Penicillium cinerascens]